jgi:hypothetical protein
MNRRVLLGTVGWLVVAATATTAGIAALDMLEQGITGRSVRPLDDEAVHRALSRSAATTPAPAPSAGPTDGTTRNLAAGGGTVTARCAAGRVTVVATIPAQGFHTGRLDRGPAASLGLTFESADKEYDVTVTCENGSPVARTATDDGHRGRG